MRRFIILGFFSIALLLSCSVKRPLVNAEVPEFQRNPFQLKLQQNDLAQELKKMLKKMSGDFAYPELLYKFYEDREFRLVLVPRFLPRDQLVVLLDYIGNAEKHGLDSAVFASQQLRKLLGKVSADTLRENKRNLAALELTVAGSLIRYSMALQFGLTIPERVYPLYTTPTLMPDSASILRVFEIPELKNYLDSIQPKDKHYLKLQKRLLSMQSAADQDSLRTMIVNLERLRWKNKPIGDKFISVNIPDFSLDVMSKGKSVLHMKVCVGEPEGWQTPQLGSMVYSVQVNPVWNIPQSIARDEISKQAANDRYYLANNNIRVYQAGKFVSDPESIDWTSVNLSDYTFQQQPGGENALGKIKFLFKNESSVYLHDTPARAVFNNKMRALSHGCVRVEKPMELAYALFGKGERFDQIKRAMQTGYPRAKFIGLPQQIPIRLNYYTAWVDNKDQVRFSKDIYGLDQLLYAAMKKINY
jgi:murein L,D-transpeptidase YcbB/YkuD